MQYNPNRSSITPVQKNARFIAFSYSQSVNTPSFFIKEKPKKLAEVPFSVLAELENFLTANSDFDVGELLVRVDDTPRLTLDSTVSEEHVVRFSKPKASKSEAGDHLQVHRSVVASQVFSTTTASFTVSKNKIVFPSYFANYDKFTSFLKITTIGDTVYLINPPTAYLTWVANEYPVNVLEQNDYPDDLKSYLEKTKTPPAINWELLGFSKERPEGASPIMRGPEKARSNEEEYGDPKISDWKT